MKAPGYNFEVKYNHKVELSISSLYFFKYMVILKTKIKGEKQQRGIGFHLLCHHLFWIFKVNREKLATSSIHFMLTTPFLLSLWVHLSQGQLEQKQTNTCLWKELLSWPIFPRWMHEGYKVFCYSRHEANPTKQMSPDVKMT